MSRKANHVSAAITSLFFAASLGFAFAADAQGANMAQAPNATAQDKAKACNDAADKKGLKDEERKTFIENCLKKMKR